MFPRLGAAVAAALLAVTVLAQPAQAAVHNVKDYGAAGNGSANDTAAINRAITAANAAGGGTVQFPPGTYRSPNSIHLKSNVTVQLDAGATIMGASGTGYDPPEDNPWDDYQDYGHSHFHNAMIWGDRLTNIAFVGQGTIDGGGHLITGNPSRGQADTHAGETARTERNHHAIGTPLVGQFGDHRYEPLGMSATDDLVSARDEGIAFEQGGRTRFRGTVYYERPHGGCSARGRG